MTLACDRCGRTSGEFTDGPPQAHAAQTTAAGWTTPTPFTDRCPRCSTEER